MQDKQYWNVATNDLWGDKMKEVKLYQCETCGMQYSDKKTAEWCEKAHKDKNLLNMTYLFLLIADQFGLKFSEPSSKLKV